MGKTNLNKLINDAVNKPEKKSKVKGLGDVIANITDALGISKCGGCERRQELFNKMFPNREYTRDFTQEELEVLDRATKNKTVVNDDVNALFKMWNEIMKPKSRLDRCNCPGILQNIIEKLNQLR